MGEQRALQSLSPWIFAGKVLRVMEALLVRYGVMNETTRERKLKLEMQAGR